MAHLPGYRPTATHTFVVALLALVLASIGTVRGLQAGGSGSQPTATSAGPAGANPTVIEVQAKGTVKGWGPPVVVEAECPEDYLVLTGGYLINSAYTVAVHSYPSLKGDRWIVTAVNPVGLPRKQASVKVFALCTKVGVPVVF